MKEITRKTEPFHRVVIFPTALPAPIEVSPSGVVKAFEAALDNPKLPKEYRALAPKVKPLGQVFGLDVSNGVELGSISTLVLAELSGKPHETVLKAVRKAFAALQWKLPKESSYKDVQNRPQPCLVLDHIQATTVMAYLDPATVPLLTLALKFFQSAFLQAHKAAADSRSALQEANKEVFRLRWRETSTLAGERQSRLIALEDNVRQLCHIVLKTSWQASSLLAPSLVESQLPKWLWIHLVLNVYALSYMTTREAHFRRAYLHLIDDIPVDQRPPNLDCSYLTQQEVAEIGLSVPHLEDTLDEEESAQFDIDLSDPESWKVPPLPQDIPSGFTFADLWSFCDPISNKNHPLRRYVRDGADIPDVPEDTLPT